MGDKSDGASEIENLNDLGDIKSTLENEGKIGRK